MELAQGATLRRLFKHLQVSALQTAVHRLANPADRQPVLCRHRVRRTVPDRANKVVYRIDTETAGDTVAVVDEVAVGRERHAWRGDFQPAMLRGAADIRCLTENINAPVVVLREALRQHPRVFHHPRTAVGHRQKALHAVEGVEAAFGHQPFLPGGIHRHHFLTGKVAHQVKAV